MEVDHFISIQVDDQGEPVRPLNRPQARVGVAMAAEMPAPAATVDIEDVTASVSADVSLRATTSPAKFAP